MISVNNIFTAAGAKTAAVAGVGSFYDITADAAHKLVEPTVDVDTETPSVIGRRRGEGF